MNDELKNVRKLIEGDDDVLFDEYINQNRFGPKFWLSVTTVVLLVLSVLVYKWVVLDKIIPPEVLKSSLEIFDIDSQWVVKEEVHEKDFHGIILVPQISFRFRNIGGQKLKYVYVLSVFRLLNRPKSLGEANKMALREVLEPGGESERIVLTCSFGYRATSKEAFARNSKEWKSATSEIYVKSGGQELLFLKTFYIIRKIEGLEMDVEVKIT
ncbi:MAG: hypothetical protein GY950_36635 [bacterium]|nr:hypothetical protein [bacterium]